MIGLVCALIYAAAVTAIIFCKDTQLECVQDSLDRVERESHWKSIHIRELQEQIELNEQVKSWEHPTKNKCKKKKKCLEGTVISSKNNSVILWGTK